MLPGLAHAGGVSCSSDVTGVSSSTQGVMGEEPVGSLGATGRVDAAMGSGKSAAGMTAAVSQMLGPATGAGP